MSKLEGDHTTWHASTSMGSPILGDVCHRLNAAAYLSTVADRDLSYMTTVHPSANGYFQLNKPSKKQISLPVWDDHDNMIMSSTIRVRLGCGATGDHGCTTDKSAWTVWGCQVSVAWNLRGKVLVYFIMWIQVFFPVLYYVRFIFVSVIRLFIQFDLICMKIDSNKCLDLTCKLAWINIALFDDILLHSLAHWQKHVHNTYKDVQWETHLLQYTTNWSFWLTVLWCLQYLNFSKFSSALFQFFYWP